MKTRTALPFLSLLLAGASFAAFSSTGCSSSSDATPAPVEDSGTDVVVDTNKADVPEKDTTPKPDTGPVSCATDLATDYACKAPTVPAGGTACTEAALQEFSTACFGADSTLCTAWTKKYAACNTCVGKFLSASGYLEYGYCMQKLAPTSACGKLYTCNIDCYETVCEACDHTAGSGRTASKSEFQDCVTDATFAGSASKVKGRCYDVVAKDLKAAACTTTDPTSGCADIVQFYRGACRDSGDWSHMMDPLFGASDAGTDTGTDTGTDSGSGDTATGTDAADGG